MRTINGRQLAAVWKHPDLKGKVAAYTRENITGLLTEYWGCSSDLYNAEKWSRVSGLWSEKEGIIE